MNILELFGSQSIFKIIFIPLLVVAILIWSFYFITRYYAPLIQILYFSELDRFFDELKITDEKGLFINADNKTFINKGGAYTARKKGKSKTIVLGKKGTAYTKKLQEGEIENIGTLWDALISCWGMDKCDGIKAELKELAIKSQIYVTVDLESGYTPKDFEPITPEALYSEADRNMAELIAEGISGVLKEDWTKLLFALGTGGLIVFICNAIGLFKW